MPLSLAFDPADAVADALRDNPHRVRVFLRGGRPVVRLDILPEGTLAIAVNPTCPNCGCPVPLPER